MKILAITDTHLQKSENKTFTEEILDKFKNIFSDYNPKNNIVKKQNKKIKIIKRNC